MMTSRHRSSLLMWLALLLSGLMLSGCDAEPVTGQLVDYRTNAPVAGATVTVTRNGWGLTGRTLVKDRNYSASTRTGPQGEFAINLPGPSLLTGSVGRLHAEADGYQRLSDVVVSPGLRLRLQTVPKPKQAVPGGMASIGYYADGTPFGWNFVDNQPTADAAHADIFPRLIERSPIRLTLTAPSGGGIRFVPLTAQGIEVASSGYLLRYLDEAPAEGYEASVVLEEAGTVFVRTRDARYAKLAFDPQFMQSGSGFFGKLDRPAKFALILQYGYNPLPGRDLPFDPWGAGSWIDPVYAAIAADVPPDGVMPKIARRYRIEVHDDSGQIIDRLHVRLEPGVPRKLDGCLPEGAPSYRYDKVELSYGDDGLPRLRLTLSGSMIAFHSADHLVGRRKASVIEFEDFVQSRMQQRELWLQEVEDKGGVKMDGCS